MWKTKQLPKFKKQLDSLIKEHRKMEDEPLHLAMVYNPVDKGDAGEIYLLEVIGGHELHSLSPDPDLYFSTYRSTPDYDIGFKFPLHLILTNEFELQMAIEDSWPRAEEMVAAIKNESFHVLFKDEIGEEILAKLKESKSRKSMVAHG